MTLCKRISTLAAKIETTVGTAETLANADGAFNSYNHKVVADIEMEMREGQGGFDQLTAVAAGRRGRITFTTDIQWDGTATEPYWADNLLPACGYVKSGQVFTPRSEAPGSNVKTLTLGLYRAGTLYTLAGCMGNFTVNLRSGMRATIDWEFSGVWAGKTDASILTPTYPTDLCLRWTGGVAQWNDVDLYASTCTITSGNTIMYREHPATSTGYHSALRTTHDPRITVNPEAKTVATQDRWGDWLTPTARALEIYLGGSGNSQLKFDAPKAQVMNIEDTDRENLVTDTIEFLCSKNGATQDQSLSITFTAAS